MNMIEIQIILAQISIKKKQIDKKFKYKNRVFGEQYTKVLFASLPETRYYDFCWGSPSFYCLARVYIFWAKCVLFLIQYF